MTSDSLTSALRETLALFEQSGTPLTTTEVADCLELGRRSTYDRLDRLVNHGRLETKKVGANARVWWRPTEPQTEDEGFNAWPTTVESLVDDVLSRVDVGVFVLDEDFEVAWASEAIERYFGIDRSQLVGREKPELVESTVAPVIDDTERFTERVLATYEQETGTERFECRVIGGDGREERWLEHRSGPIESGPYAGGRVEVYYDVTYRKRRERKLRENRAQYETIVDTVEDGIYAVNEEMEFVVVNDGFCELTGYDREELLGTHVSMVHDNDEIMPRVESKLQTVIDTDRESARIELDIRTKSGETVPCESRFALFPLEGSYGRCGVVRDVSDRLEREQKLQRRIHQQKSITKLGRQALEVRDIDTLLTEATRQVAKTLGNDYCKILDLDADADELLLRHGVGWHDGIVGSATVSAVADDSQAAHTLRTDQPVVVSDLKTETRFSGPDLLREHDVRSGISTIIGPSDDPWGILGTHDTAAKSFSTHDVNFVQSVANILASAIARHADERELVRQRERLAALNSLNEVVRETTEVVINQSTREEIEETVCEFLAKSDSYSFAWVGDVDTTSKKVNVRTKAGTKGYLDDIVISVDPNDERSNGPTGRAFKTGEIQTTQNIDQDPSHDPWREHVETHEFRSSAAIPIIHEDAIYGVLNVYSKRLNAFEGEERAVVEQLGEIIGHAIAATERKRALMSDDVIEIAFQIPDVFEELDAESNQNGRISFDHMMPIEDERYLLYGSATEDAIDNVRSIVEQLPYWESVSFHDEGKETDFEAQLSNPPVLSVVASAGGSIKQAVIEDGDYNITVHVAPTADIRQITKTIEETYPMAQLLKHRQVTRRDNTTNRIQRVLRNQLTERQQTALEAAYHAGFFQWPRETTGGGVAESLGVSPPTFHQHLRKAEQKVFDHLLSTVLPTQPPSPRTE
ncbi:GAF domain-containing protein [Halogeometricum borinquense]|uniref:GAF domain-containing protein n=1 Tax=Halogeometricum borinquense TaxID=60847 RepID=A0A6C0UJ63_9EURY|nr:bacterio-opsin activator domain-containing protein [Halogeometricum borinquense]QIB75475.1 GAF domain-containing protein [Halogeometricum borinquense]